MSIVKAYQRLQRVYSIVISDRLVFETPETFIFECINATQRQLGLWTISDVVARAFWTKPAVRKFKLSGVMGFKGDPNIWWSIYHTYDTPDARYRVTKVRPDAAKAIRRFRHLGKTVHIVSPEIDSISRAQVALIDETIFSWSVSNGQPMAGCFGHGSLGAIMAKDGCYNAPEQVVVIGDALPFALAAYVCSTGFIYFKMGEGDLGVAMFADAGEIAKWDHVILAFSK